MSEKTLYQTVEDRNNPSEIEDNGPFACRRSNAWLGLGSYFWDTFVDLAHWWGNMVYDGKYVICQSACNGSLQGTFDLYNDFCVLQEFSALKNALQERLHRKNISVGDVLCYLMRHSDFCSRYKAIRAKATGCMKHAPTMRFVNYNVAYLELMPPVQFCVLDKSFLLGGTYNIVYPKKYISQMYDI